MSDPIIPLRLLTEAEKQYAIHMDLKDAKEARNSLKCGCGQNWDDSCSLCEKPLCKVHAIPAVTLATSHNVPLLVFNYCSDCLTKTGLIERA